MTLVEIQKIKGDMQDAVRAYLVASEDYNGVLEVLGEDTTKRLGATADHYGQGIEYDDELEAQEPYVVSEGSDPGAFVLTWTWVTNEVAGIPDDDDEDEEEDRLQAESDDPMPGGFS